MNPLDLDELDRGLTRLPPGPYREACCAKHELEDAREDGLACYGVYSGEHRFRPDPRVIVPLLNAAPELIEAARRDYLVAWDQLEAGVERIDPGHLLRVNADLRAQLQRVLNERILTCAYCGQQYPPDTPNHGAPVLTAHIEQCEKHPMRPLKRVLKAAQAVIAESVGPPDPPFGTLLELYNAVREAEKR